MLVLIEKKHPETGERARKKFRENNLEKVREQDRISQKKRRKSNPEANKKRLQAFRARKEVKLWQIAGRPRANECEICLESGKTVFDHCHSNGKFRGWICDRCNRILGSVKDSQKLLFRMINYLDKFYENA